MSNNSNHKVINTTTLENLQDAAIEAGYNRTLGGIDIDDVDPDGFHILTSVMFHSHAAGLKVDPHHRCSVLVKMTDQHDPVESFIDVSFEDFDNLLDAVAVRERLKAQN